VQSLSVDPAAAAHGAAVTATVELTNPGDKRSKKINLLLKLRAPDGESGLLLTSQRVGKLKAGQSRTVELAAFIPDGAPSGDSTLVACRAKKDSADACGVSRQETPLRVLTPANLRISPGAHAFESHATGTTSPTRTLTVTNLGETASTPIATSITGADPGQFTKSADGCDGQALAAGESCEVNAAFTPTATGSKSGGLRASTSESSATAALTGTGVAPANLTISPSPHGFGTHATGTTSPAQTFTVTNTGGAPSGTIATSIGGADPAQFARSADNCNGQTLAPGASCTVAGAFAPTSLGAKAASLQVSATPGGSAAAALSGTGATPANLTISPSPHGFGAQVINTTSGAQTFTVTNTGGVPSGTISTALAGANSNQFTKSADNCDGQTLAPAASCTVNAAFSPTTSGVKAAAVTAAASPGGSAQADLSGTGQTAANLTITPDPEDFGTVVQGASATRTFTVTNTGEQTSGVITISKLGAQQAQFSVLGSTTCGPALTGAATCTIDLRWTPPAPFTGDPAATLSASASPGSSDSSTLNGNAITPADLTITPSSYDFGNVLQNDTALKTFTITNTGQQTSDVPFVDITTVTGFSLQSTTCSTGLALNQTCTADVAFTPNAVAPFASNLRVFANPGANPPTLAPLSGTGVATAASLRIGLRRFGDSSPVVYGTGGTIGTNSTGLNGVEVWIRNIGAADAHISPATIPITLNNSHLIVDNTSTCPVASSDDFVSQITFTDTTIAGGPECHIDIEAGHVTSGAWSASFTITGSPGGSITGTVTGI
jgi:hypothetical protein